VVLQKKRIIRVFFKLRDIGRDTIINNLLSHYNIHNGLLLYNIITAKPIDIAIAIIASKFGVSKFIITLIIAFLI
jgi:hypothetical protein